MTPKDIQEIASLYKKMEDLSIQRFAGCVVSSEKKIVQEIPVRQFLTYDLDIKEQYLKMIKKVLKCSELYDRLLFAPVHEMPVTLMLQETVKNKMQAGLKDLYDNVICNFGCASPFAILCFYNVYDIPTASELESEEVYPHIITLICPISMEEPGIIIKDNFEMKERRWNLNQPAAAFIYPAFSERRTDWNQMLFYNDDPLNPQKELARSYGMEDRESSSEYREDIYTEIYNEVGSKKTAEIIMRSFANRMKITAEDVARTQVEITPEEIGEVLKIDGMPGNRIAENLTSCWPCNPFPFQLYTTQMVKKHLARMEHQKLLQLMAASKNLADNSGNKDLSAELEELLNKEANRG